MKSAWKKVRAVLYKLTHFPVCSFKDGVKTQVMAIKHLFIKMYYHLTTLSFTASFSLLLTFKYYK